MGMDDRGEIRDHTRPPQPHIDLLVETLYRNWSKLKQEYPALGDMTPDELAPSTNPHPYAEGAVRFFKEAGLWSEAHEIRQGQLLRGER